MAVVVMIAFARSGGTVLNQCLGSLQDVVIMSEVNPLGGGWGDRGANSLTTVKDQAKYWYQIELKSNDFLDSVLELEKICMDTKRHLILRDWTFSNFMPHLVNGFEPPNQLLTLETLSGKCDIRPFVFIRDAIDVWISRGVPPAEEFFTRYLKYVNAIFKYPVYKYEEFCLHPTTLIKEICDYSGMTYSESWHNYQDFRKVHGDIQTSQKSRGVRQKKIQPLPRKRIPAGRIHEVNNCPEMMAVNELTSYPTSYSSAPLESIASWMMSKIRRKVNSVVNKVKDP